MKNEKEYTMKLWTLRLILLFCVLSASSKAIAQGRYCFDSLQVKKIAYELEEKKLLLKDTADYRLQIRVLEQKSFSLSLAKESWRRVAENNEYEANILKSDVTSLKIYSETLESENKSLRRKIKVGKVIIPVSFGCGVILTTILLK